MSFGPNSLRFNFHRKRQHPLPIAKQEPEASSRENPFLTEDQVDIPELKKPYLEFIKLRRNVLRLLQLTHRETTNGKLIDHISTLHDTMKSMNKAMTDGLTAQDDNVNQVEKVGNIQKEIQSIDSLLLRIGGKPSTTQAQEFINKKPVKIEPIDETAMDTSESPQKKLPNLKPIKNSTAAALRSLKSQIKVMPLPGTTVRTVDAPQNQPNDVISQELRAEVVRLRNEEITQNQAKAGKVVRIEDPGLTLEKLEDRFRAYRRNQRKNLDNLEARQKATEKSRAVRELLKASSKAGIDVASKHTTSKPELSRKIDIFEYYEAEKLKKITELKATKSKPKKTKVIQKIIRRPIIPEDPVAEETRRQGLERAENSQHYISPLLTAKYMLEIQNLIRESEEQNVELQEEDFQKLRVKYFGDIFSIDDEALDEGKSEATKASRKTFNAKDMEKLRQVSALQILPNDGRVKAENSKNIEKPSQGDIEMTELQANAASTQSDSISNIPGASNNNSNDSQEPEGAIFDDGLRIERKDFNSTEINPSLLDDLRGVDFL